jgi:hypothetical protein
VRTGASLTLGHEQRDGRRCGMPSTRDAIEDAPSRYATHLQMIEAPLPPPSIGRS